MRRNLIRKVICWLQGLIYWLEGVEERLPLTPSEAYWRAQLDAIRVEEERKVREARAARLAKATCTVRDGRFRIDFGEGTPWS